MIAMMIYKVDGDDYGDKLWQWRSKIYKDGTLFWDDYHTTRPTIKQLFDTIVQVV